MAKRDPKSKKLLEELKPEIKDWLKENVSQRRYEHINRVANTAKKYAKVAGVDPFKTELSAWLHDCAKEVKNDKLLKLAKNKQIPLDDVDLANPHILHARVGAKIAEKEFGIKDRDILAGIRCHTLAEPNMSDIAMVVYLADATEPGREKKKTLKARQIFMKKGLKPAVLQAIDDKLVFVIQKGGRIHPLTINARNWLVGELKNGKSRKKTKRKKKANR